MLASAGRAQASEAAAPQPPPRPRRLDTIKVSRPRTASHTNARRRSRRSRSDSPLEGFGDDESLVKVGEGSRLLSIIASDAEQRRPKEAAKDGPNGPTKADRCREVKRLSPTLRERGSRIVRRIRLWGRGLWRKRRDGAPGEGPTTTLLDDEAATTESHDSGLGEESDCDVVTAGAASASASSGFGLNLSSSRKLSSASSSKKHVSIREPSVIHLPSARRKPRLETVRIRPAAYSSSSHSCHGSVAPQWRSLRVLARQDVINHVLDCDAFTVSLIFDLDTGRARREVRGMRSSDKVADLVHSVYKILYFDWMSAGKMASAHLAVILHLVQVFLVVVAEETATAFGPRYSRLFSELVSECQSARFVRIDVCLRRTRSLYVGMWCEFLCIPFS